ncbi:MAG: hypothetical protein H7255_05395 [Ramlibacter sp.]|nr:hypothetical protein [Ramlibacter sp.]
MIYKFVMDNLVRIGIGVAILLAVFWLYQFVTAAPKAEARLGKNQAEAAAQSGSDAVNTVGAAGEREAGSADLTRSNDVEIRNAEGASTVVAPAADAAGRASLCRRASYSKHPECVQRAHP